MRRCRSPRNRVRILVAGAAPLPGSGAHRPGDARHGRARSHGYPVPQVDERTETDLILDRLDGPTMLADLGRRPWRLVRHARTLAQRRAVLRQLPVVVRARLADPYVLDEERVRLRRLLAVASHRRTGGSAP